MELKLISTELRGETIQLTYTDGQSTDQAKELLIVRVPFDGDLNYSIHWNQFRVLEQLREWTNKEGRRLRAEVEGN